MAEKAINDGAVYWGTRIGVVMAVAGSAVGLGNFLRFPGNAAAHGAGAFMIPYFIALLLVGIPMAWAEWSMGRYAGRRGFHSTPAVFASLCRSKWGSYIGTFSLLIPMMVYTYYVVVEAWCLGYAWHYLTGTLGTASRPANEYSNFFEKFTGQGADGSVLKLENSSVLIFILITFAMNFALIVRGLNKGVEAFCKVAMPLMIVCALCVLVRVLTLGTPKLDLARNIEIYQNSVKAAPENPERYLWLATAQQQADQADNAAAMAKEGLSRIEAMSVALADLEHQLQSATERKEKRAISWKIAESKRELNKPSVAKTRRLLQDIASGKRIEPPDQSVAGGLNFMWNPDFSKLREFKTWLAAAGQIFFSLSVGFGVIINYASYLRPRDDIALSGLTASTTNEFFEVCLGGLITLPAAFIFLGLTAATFGTFSLGFSALPNVFELMPGGRIFGFLWFLMLFLAAITSSLSMLQPVNAFFEEGLGLRRSVAALLLGLVTAGGCAFVVYYSQGLKALDNIDYWCGTFLIVVLALIQSVIYGWVFGTQAGKDELDRGALIRVPSIIQPVLKFITPIFLLLILGGTILDQSGNYINQFQTDPVAQKSVYLILGAIGFLVVLIAVANARWQRQRRFEFSANEK
jgi:SNF family Na+-dependent transporter